MFLECGRKLGTWEERTQTQGEHASSEQKGPDPRIEPGTLFL